MTGPDASERILGARVFFEAAERDWAARRYADAAKGYQKSLDVLQTMSAHLNHGLTLLSIPAFTKAEKAFFAGLQMARKKENQRFEVTCPP